MSSQFRPLDIVIIMSTSWEGRHESKHTEYIGQPGILQKKSMANDWWYVLVVPDDVHADVALYHESNLELAGDSIKGPKLKVSKEVVNDIWARH